MLVLNHDYRGKCWWCGDPADSAEHKHKRSDLVREFGPGPYTGLRELVVHGTGLPSGSIGGPSSKAAKFDKNLCQRCNNERSQPFDRAYDEFVAYIDQHARQIRRRRLIDLKEIWGTDWPAKRHDLLRYWVKHLACRAVTDQSVYIVPEVIDYLNGGPPPPSSLVFDLTIWGEAALIIDEAEKLEGIDRFGFVGISPSWLHPDPETGDPSAIEGTSPDPLAPGSLVLRLQRCRLR